MDSFSKVYETVINPVSKEIELIKNKMLSSISDCPNISEDIRTLFAAPSKFIRSAMCLLFLKTYGIEITSKHIDLLTATELIHNASLIHDDTIDEADKRRSIQTLNTKFSSKLAVLAGDYVLSIAMQMIAALEQHNITEKFAKTLQLMTEAELNQYFTKFQIPSIEQYIKKSKNKTAQLFNTALESCLIISETEIEEASDFALNFGIAFQLRDDLKNVSATNEGKPVLSDIQNGIYTAPYIFAQGLTIDNDAIEKSKDLLNNYIRRANITIRRENKEYLLNLIRILENV